MAGIMKRSHGPITKPRKRLKSGNVLTYGKKSKNIGHKGNPTKEGQIFGSWRPKRIRSVKQ